ncbi:MAG: neutral/alkaline non-lysosomal ceramidase N-terminal domain-containing protein [Armatimonadota bacterium]|nr:neutral/alkaline non-lysosomal ceramidase N-terminal domain-containing protein [bacterium]MCS7309512.1 neutral/alkaline non-lysosomal ceramidase N-terminal domain-containing protein [Armatimonadota bacterium]MDW8290864.1 neutral/alkaline non-lysosomal ceramidase N-terminal domain-containing protein [Armatimonadota bacterium]
MALKAAVCEANITPPVGVWLAGYAGRPSGCLGVHDELYARALVLEDGISLAAIVSLDLVALDFDLVATIRDGVSRKVGIPPERLLLNCSHTHSGPVTRTFRAMGERDDLYCDVMARKVIGAVQQAADMLEPASLYWGRASVQIGVNRRERRDGQTVLGQNPNRPVQPYVDVLRVEREGGAPLATLFAHATHPVVLGSQNLWISADFPGMACEFLRRVGMGVPMFLQGCAGDINPLLRGPFAQARKAGETLGASVVVASHLAEPVEGIPLSGTLRTVDLPYLFPSPEEAQQHLQRAEAELKQAEEKGEPLHVLMWHRDMLRWAQDLVLTVEKGEPKSLPLEIQLLRLGDVHLLAFPAEMFVQYALDFVRQSPHQPTIVLGYTNGCWGYIPAAADYPFGGYEVEMAYRYYGTLMVSADCERLIREEAYSLLGVPSPDRTPYAAEM